MQTNCSHLNDIRNKVENEDNKNFKLQQGILYKVHQNALLLCIPTSMARPIIDTLHNKYGFHFPARHLVLQLQNLVYTQHVKRLCEETVSVCPICIMGTPRKLKKIVGNVRSDIFQPGQTLIADSAFLPQDRMGFSKAIVLVDAASSHVAILPTKNLK